MDSDSYVKWASALASRLPADWQARLVVLEGHAAPSPRQVDDALAGGIDPHDLGRVGARGLARLLADWSPDVLLLGVRAHAVPAVTGMLDASPRRPVVVTGVAGIALPVQWYDVSLRRAADLFVVHGLREQRELTAVARAHDVPCRPALATLPFLARAPATVGGRTGGGDAAGRGPVVFAPQALVPFTDHERERLVARLADTARAHPDRDVLVKLRSRAGEVEAHRESRGYAEIVRDLAARGGAPSNLRVVDGPMAQHLSGAAGLVTVSSSSALEAVAAGVPALVLDDFGVNQRLMNSVFADSGLLGSTDDLVAGRFRHLDPHWAEDNYFHHPDADTWVDDVEELLARRSTRGLPPCPRPAPTLGHRLRDAYYRRDALAPWRGTPLAGAERAMLAGARWVNRRALHLR